MVFFCLSTAVYSQENKNELTEAQKEELRKNHTNGLQFSSSKSSNAKQLKITSTTEQEDIKVTNVKYYNGTQDTLYREYKYTKPE